ncbi:hypothetical protein DPMN_055443 [Dreissena polymorpha]|uniref:Uncharacterized protein n=1 Tax=Dreissena polymorpha TaxID=45954 RepID=A0A9D4CRV8_DREPO|nr:hypothetical protein DPMN_055443 [Dreissena polymorpha]
MHRRQRKHAALTADEELVTPVTLCKPKKITKSAIEFEYCKYDRYVWSLVENNAFFTAIVE